MRLMRRVDLHGPCLDALAAAIAPQRLEESGGARVGGVPALQPAAERSSGQVPGRADR